ncbi:MAG TPA: hypothetical protein PLX08_06770 [Bacteroidales bacterium]|nr:hypothetical protein [Bacteroidales bacterium]
MSNGEQEPVAGLRGKIKDPDRKVDELDKDVSEKEKKISEKADIINGLENELKEFRKKVKA